MAPNRLRSRRKSPQNGCGRIWLLLALLAVVLFQSTTLVDATSRNGPRGVRARRRDNTVRDLKKSETTSGPTPLPTLVPTLEETLEQTDAPKKAREKGNEAELAAEEQQAAEKETVDKKKNNNQDDGGDNEGDDGDGEDDFYPNGDDETATDAPTSTPQDATIAEAEERTSGPTEQETLSPTVAPTVAPTVTPTALPTEGAVSATEEVEEEESISESTPTPTMVEEAASSGGNSTQQPHLVTLEPFYMKVSMSGNSDSYEGGFMEVLVDYMETNMANDFEKFESISYGVSTFSQTTDLPPAAARNQDTATATREPITNVTVHVHLMTATFRGEPGVPDRVIEEYMEMLLENPAMLQEYIDTQPELAATIYATELEFEDIVSPTDVHQSQTTTEAQEETAGEDSGKRNVKMIAGVTVGCFVALVWMVYLYGVQRHNDVVHHIK